MSDKIQSEFSKTLNSDLDEAELCWTIKIQIDIEEESIGLLLGSSK